MEYLQWVLQSKSLAAQVQISQPILNQLSKVLSLDSYQVSGTLADSVVFLCYLLVIAGKMTAARVKVLAALLFSLVVAYSPIYSAVNDVGYYCMLSVIYITAYRHITNKQIKSTTCIMAIFQLFMAIDSYVNPNTETWLYHNFEEVTLLIHLLIVSSCARLKPIKLGDVLGRFIAAMRGVAHSQCLAPCV